MYTIPITRYKIAVTKLYLFTTYPILVAPFIIYEISLSNSRYGVYRSNNINRAGECLQQTTNRRRAAEFARGKRSVVVENSAPVVKIGRE